MLTPDSYSHLVAIAKQITKDEKKTDYYFLRAALPQKRFEIFCLTYSYFRLFDDVIDAPNLASEVIQEIVNDEKRYLIDLYESRRSNPIGDPNVYHSMLWHIVNYDISQDAQMRELLYEMFKGFEFDAENRYKVCSQEALDRYAMTAGKALVKFIWHFTSQDRARNDFGDELYLGGFGAQRVHNIRDFFIDCELGYYYAVRWHELDELSESSILGFASNQAWVKKETDLAEDYIQRGLREARKIKNLRFRIFVFALSAKYLAILEKIRDRNYCLSRSYIFSSRDVLRINLWIIYNLLFAWR